jgi:prolipoprotein diacylglyceryltransferase
VVAIVVVVLLLGRLGKLTVSSGMLVDMIAAGLAFGLVVVRIGCLLAGCCSGAVSHVPWAIRFPSGSQLWHAQVEAGIVSATAVSSLPVHPLQIYFALLSLCAGVVVVWMMQHRAYEGQAFLVYAALYGFGQYTLEFLRFGPLPHLQYSSFAIAMAATGALLVRGWFHEWVPRRVQARDLSG